MLGNFGRYSRRGRAISARCWTCATVSASWTNGTFYAHHNSDKSRAGRRGDPARSAVLQADTGTTNVGTYEYSVLRMLDNLKSSIGNDVSRFKFSSKQRDLSTGLYYYGYRFYSPQWQRWVSRDPMGEEDDANLYLFVGRNPNRWVDSSGLGKGKPAPKPRPKPRLPKKPPIPKQIGGALLKYGIPLTCCACAAGLGGIEAICAGLDGVDFVECVCELAKDNKRIETLCSACLAVTPWWNYNDILKAMGCDVDE